MTDTSIDSRQTAAGLAIALRCGWITVAEAVEWVDARIAESDEPDADLIEASLLYRRSAYEVSDVLKVYARNFDPALARRTLLSLLHVELQQQELSTREVARQLYNAWLGDCESWQPLRNEIISADDAFDLAAEGYGSMQEAEALLRELVAAYPPIDRIGA